MAAAPLPRGVGPPHRAPPGIVPRDADDTAQLVGTTPCAGRPPGRDVRELQRSLWPRWRRGASRGTAALTVERPGTLLGRLQADQWRRIAPGSAPRRSLTRRPAPSRCTPVHGAERQVEVLREVVVGLLEDDPSLEPRDVVVMFPDIETFAPLFAAAFGRPPHPRQADLGARAPRGTRSGSGWPIARCRRVNPLLGLALAVLELAGARSPRTEVLDLAATEPVRPPVRARATTRWRRMAGGSATAGVRWGLDGAQRERFGLGVGAEHVAQRSGPAGRRGQAGTAEGARHIGAALPLDEVASGDVDLAGRLVAFLAGVRCGQRRGSPGATGDGALVDGRPRRPRRAHRPLPRRDAWQSARSSTASSAGARPIPFADARSRPDRRAACATLGGPLRCCASGSRGALPSELPDREADGVHDGADALGAAPGDVPPRPRRRDFPTPASTATTSRPPSRSPASATRAARTASCCSTP